MKRWTFLLPLLVASPAYALDRCQPTKVDPQVRTCEYNPLQRYVVQGPVGFPVNLKFGDSEQIKRLEPAQNGVDKDQKPVQTWEGPKCPNAKCEKERWQTNLPIWPRQQGHSSLIVVTQTADGKERAYQFDLIATKEADEDTTSALVFTYKAEVDEATKRANEQKRQEAAAAWKAQQAKKSEEDAVARLKQEVFYSSGPRNWMYRAKGEEKYKTLAPSKVSDNGMETVFEWPGNIERPTIAIIDPATQEPRRATPDQQGDMVVVHTTAEHWRLSLGHEAVLDLYNKAWSADRPDPHTGTSSPDVMRQITYQDQNKKP